MFDLDELLDAAIEGARRGAAELRAAFGHSIDARVKAHPRDLVTQADGASERAILAYLGARTPAIGLLAEESGLTRTGADALWVVDPLDGTSNFARGYPIFSVSVGCVDRDGPLVGVVLDPARDELFSAGRGRGARLNGVPLQVSAAATLDRAFVSTGFPYFPPKQRRLAGEVFVELLVEAQDVRRGGSAAIDLAYVAAGRSEAHVELGLAPHDVAAGVLLVTEAGGRVDAMVAADAAGWPRGFLATNGTALHEQIGQRYTRPFGLGLASLRFASLFDG